MKQHCISYDRITDNPHEKVTLDWLDKSNINSSGTNLGAIKDDILCMSMSSPNYTHLTIEEKEMVNKLFENEGIVDIVLSTLFRWFGSPIGQYCIKDLVNDIEKVKR